MLILSRKNGEEIIVGNDIVIKITEITKAAVKIGIDAPRETVILRGELKQKIKEINEKSCENSDIDKIQNLSKKLKK